MSWEIYPAFSFCSLPTQQTLLEQRSISSDFSRSQVIEIENTKT